MQRTISCTSGSARSASAQLVQLAVHIEALFDTAQERVVIDTCRLGMCLDYVSNRHDALLLSVGP